MNATIDREMIRAQVTVGIIYLSDHVDGSIHVLARHLDRLNVASLTDCPLGILFGEYSNGKSALNLNTDTCEELGFSSSFESCIAGLDEYPALTREWRLQVTEWVTEAARDMVATA